MSTEVTKLLHELRLDGGDADHEALNRLLPLVYDELRRLASSFLSREHAVSIQTTELVHEAYFKLMNQRTVDWENRGQFFAIAAQAMRRILLDAARSRKAARRNGIKIAIDSAPTIASKRDEDLLILDEALQELQMLDERQGRIVELRYFAGLTIEQTAEVLKVSPATVKREWTMARAWLFRRIHNN